MAAGEKAMHAEQKSLSPELIAVVLLLLTGILWLLYEFALDRVLIIDVANSDIRVSVRDDRSEGGDSVSTLVKSADSWKLSYSLGREIPFPFSGIRIDVTRRGHGLDLSKYGEIRIWAKSDDPSKNLLRMELRNSNPAYTVANNDFSLKYNEVYFPQRGLDAPSGVTLSDFSVVGWWITKMNIPFEHSRVDVSNVAWIELQTPEMGTVRTGSIELKKIEFRGKWISPADFYRMLLILWLSVWAVFVVGWIWRLRRLVREKTARERELLELNELLALQAKDLETKAMRDELTGMLNRHGLRNRLFDAIETARRQDADLSLIIVDIDNFKAINDGKGHPEGDADGALYKAKETGRNQVGVCA